MLTAMSRIAFYCVTTLIYGFSNPVYAGKNTQINVTAQGKSFPTGSKISISADGRYVAFSSDTPKLVTEDNNKWHDVFVRDLLTRKTQRISISSNGTAGNNDSYTPIISADGRYVVFDSVASNLVANATNTIKGGKIQDVFVHDLLTKQTTRVSVSSKGVQADSYSFGGDISADGRYVAFTSTATTLVAKDANKWSEDVFVHDRVTKQTTLVNVSSKGIQGNWRSLHPSLSANGRYVVFLSNATNLVANDTNAGTDVFVHDRLQKKTTVESVASNSTRPASAFWDIDNWQPSISADGSKVVFKSDSTRLVPNDKNNETDVFVHDRIKNHTVRVSSAGAQAIGDVERAAEIKLSANGRYVGFSSKAINLIKNDNNNLTDAFIHDLTTKQTTRTSVTNAGLEQKFTIGLFKDLSADGRYAVFTSVTFDKSRKNLIYNDFMRDRLLDTQHHADLTIALAQKIAVLKPSTKGSYLYTITNNGPHAVKDVSVLHLLSEPNTTGFKTSQGSCSVALVETACHFGKLAAGKTLSLQVTITARSRSFTQKISVSGEPVDAVPSNNYLSTSTVVKNATDGGGYNGEVD